MSLPFASAGAAWVTPSLIVSVIGLSLTVLLYVLNTRKARKALGYSVDVRRLVEVNPQARGSVQVIFDGHPVDDPHLIEVEIANTGRVPIEEDDFARALTVAVPVGAEPISAVTPIAEPNDLDPQVTMDADGVVKLEPLLLNAGDTVTISVLTRSEPSAEDITLSGRIVGIKSFKATRRATLSDDPWIASAPWARVSATAVAVFSIAAALGALRSDEDTKVTLKDGRIICATSTTDAAGGMLVLVRAGDSRRLVYAPDEVATVERQAC